jgi:exosortase
MDDARRLPPSTAATIEPRLVRQKVMTWDGVQDWFRRQPADAAMILVSFGIVLGFYFSYKAYFGGFYSALHWLWDAWNDENDFVHGKFSPVIIGALLFLLRDKLWAAAKKPSLWGAGIAGFGILVYLLSVRMLQPRVAIAALPIILIGLALAFWGKKVAQLLFFPFFFLYLMVPIPGLEQKTAALQLVITKAVAAMVGLFGIQVEAIGATLHAAGNDGFTFEIAGGCSGVRSLMAMTMITALYVYFTQNALWKKVVIFGASLAFAVLGNIGRVTSIVLMAKFGFKDVAVGTYHDNASLIIFFPFAMLAMIGFAKLVNLDWPGIFKRLTRKDAAPATAAADGASTTTTRPEDKY